MKHPPKRTGAAQPTSPLRHPIRMSTPSKILSTRDAARVVSARENGKGRRTGNGHGDDRSPQEMLDEAYGIILAALGKMGYPIHDDNFRDTGPRAARGLLELVRPVPE